jgi:hypothetical protein
VATVVTVPGHSAGNPAPIGPGCALIGTTGGPTLTDDIVIVLVFWTDPFGGVNPILSGISNPLHGGTGWHCTLGDAQSQQWDPSLVTNCPPDGAPIGVSCTLVHAVDIFGFTPDAAVTTDFVWDRIGVPRRLAGATGNPDLAAILAAVVQSMPTLP